MQVPLPSMNLLNALYFPPAPDSSTFIKNKAVINFQCQNNFENGKVKTLETVVIKSTEKTPEQKMNEEYTSGFFSSEDAHTFILEGDPTANSNLSVLNYLQGKVAGLTISIDGGSNATATWRGSNTSFFRDEVNTDINSLQTISMSDVAMIKVFPPPFFG